MHTDHRELQLAAVLLAVTCVLAFAPDAYLPMLVRSGMRIGAGALMLFSLWCSWRRWWWASGASILASFIILIHTQVPALAPMTHMGHGLRVAHFNVLQPNRQRSEVIDAILATNAELVSVQEVDEAWAMALIDGLVGAYPYHHVVPRSDCYGIALFSRRPFEQVATLEVQGAPFIEAVVPAAEQRVRLLVVHATSPTSLRHHQRRNAQLRELSTLIADSHLPTVLVGDLNTVHWDEAFRALCVGSGSRPVVPASSRTWPAIGPLALIPLDHLLLSPGMGYSSLALCDIPGSDHRGLVADIFPVAP
jgi:endonuclease/exonuclease/phosphatase (EEP) superfamily protein YafD